jgi:FkbM family methyltransferase
MEIMTDQLIGVFRRLQRHSPVASLNWRISQLCDRIAAKTGRRIIRTNPGFLMDLDIAEFVSRVIYLSGDYEPHICAELRTFLKPGSVFVDCGANIGYLSLYASGLVGPRGRVFSIEPNPRTFQELTRNVDLNGASNIRLLAVGLAEAAGSTILYPNDRNSGRASLIPDGGTGVTIPIDTYDRLAQTESIPTPDVLKIDIEGAEEKALLGMRGLLGESRKPVIICEISEWSLAQLGSSRERLVALLSDYGYRRVRILPPIRSSNAAVGLNLHFQFDAVFLPT